MSKTNLNNTCPACDIGNLNIVNREQTYNYKGKNFTLSDVEFSICDHCQTELMTPEQHKKDAKCVFKYKKQIEGLLSSSDIKRIRKKYKLTQIQAAILFGGGINCFSKYERSEVMQSTSMDKLLKLVDLNESNFKLLQKISGVTVCSSTVESAISKFVTYFPDENINSKSKSYKGNMNSMELTNSTWHGELKAAS